MNKKIKLLCFTFVLGLLSSVGIVAQVNTVSSGGEATGSGGSASYTLGEVVYSSFKTNGGYVIEGVQQTYTDAELPISLFEFKASVTANKQIAINWATVSEQNNKYFTVERSSDGITFLSIQKLNSKGNTLASQLYSTIDATPLNGTSYYRLKQTDFDGKSTYSKSIMVTITSTDTELSAYPNPTTSLLNLKIKDALQKRLTYEIFSVDGKAIDQQKIKNDITTIPTSKLVNGAYLLQVKQNNSVIKTFRIIKN